MHMLRRFIRHRKYLPICIEAFVDLAICKMLIAFAPFRFYAKKYGIAYCETLQEDMTASAEQLKAIRFALRVIPKFLPWPSKCLDQAMAAQRMLVRRRLQSTIYFGMARDQSQKLIAHAWLRSGNCWVIGYQPQVAYRVVGVYAWYPL